MKQTYFFCHLMLSALLSFACTALRAQTIEGQVMLGDGSPASFATVFLPSTGYGTVANQDGYYKLMNLPQGTVEVEYSYLGYKTVRHPFTIDGTKTVAHDEKLEEQAIMLNDVYITPTGEDPALYILSKVAERAAVNRKSLQHYEAHRQFVFHSQDLDFIPEVFPKAINWLITSMMKLHHRGAIYSFCCDHEQADASMSSTMIYDRGHLTYTDEKLISSNPVMPDKVREQLFKISRKDPFDKLYGNDTDYSLRQLKKGKCKYRLKGTLEENGHKVDVLVNEEAGDADNPGVRTLYVIEDDWCILRSEFNSKMQYERMECRNIVDNIYLPVSYVDEPTFASLGLEQEIEKYRTEQKDKADRGEKPTSTERKLLDRMERYAQSHTNPKPSIATGYGITYSAVRLAK